MDSVDVVIGAGGPTGLECVRRLLELGSKVRAVVRNPSKYADVLPPTPNLEVVSGDVTDKSSLLPHLQNARGVIFAASTSTSRGAKEVDNKGVGILAECCREAGVKQVVLVSSALVTKKNRFHPTRVLLNNIVRWKLMDNKFQGEERLRASGVPFTVIRPVHLSNKPAGESQLHTAQGDSVTGGVVTRSDVAAVCCASLTNPLAVNRTFSLYSKTNKESAGAPSLDKQLMHLFNDLLPGMHN